MEDYTIKGLNLKEEEILEIAKKMNMTVEEVLTEDDYHIEKSLVDMYAWIFDGCTDIIDLLSALENTSIKDSNLSLLENFKEYNNPNNIFELSDGSYLFLYV